MPRSSYKKHHIQQSRHTKTKHSRIFIIACLALMLTIVGIITIHMMDVAAQIRHLEHIQHQDSINFHFNPGRIISDEQFFNDSALNKHQLQAFLNNQGKQCQNKQCLKSAVFTTVNEPADDLCKGYKGGNKQTAAEIINNTSHACHISQKVILTLLQKEQHLVSSTNPTHFQYKAATGLSCPDNAHCDPKYAGFFKQVYGAAHRFQYYRAHADQYQYKAKQINFIQYHPNSQCGGSKVYIENTATALLYNYTPYQPNHAALIAAGGEGDHCSSYGNRNFSLIYNSWFDDPDF